MVIVLLSLVVLVAACGFIYENIAETRDTQQNPMPGRLVKVAGLTMHIDCMGQGTPAVILESGLGDSYVSWRKVQPQMAKFTRVCSYDRAGLGFSDSSSGPRTSQVIAEELHALLGLAGVAPPHVLVGHSMGGFDVRVYTSFYRSDVAGLVLVDASHPDQEKRFPLQIKNREGSWQREALFMEYTMPFGIPRLLGLCDPDPVIRAAECNFHSAREAVEEMKSFADSAAQTAAAASLSDPPLGDLPLTVLSHDPDKPSSEFPADLAKQTNEAWEKMQEEMAHLSTRGTQTIAKRSAHYIQFDRPEVVIDSVRNVVDQVRQPRSMAPSR
jgi:pimeloyl-ACP methyl ester carboxylesterase